MDSTQEEFLSSSPSNQAKSQGSSSISTSKDFVTPTKEFPNPRQLRSLHLLNSSKQKQEPEAYKDVQSIHQGLIFEYGEAETIDEFKSCDFVQRAANDIAFVARRNDHYPIAFELQDDVIFQLCTSCARVDGCEQFG